MDDCKFRCEVSPKVSKMDLIENLNKTETKILRLYQFSRESFALGKNQAFVKLIMLEELCC